MSSRFLITKFRAPEYRADASFRLENFEFRGSEKDGWQVLRNGKVQLELGPGYRLLETERCGVCSTDLARQFLPFPLPQITGHEVVALNEEQEPCVVEINASHAARGVVDDCAYCARGLETHCPQRLVLGIHDLPGGFGPWILAPKNAVLKLPEEIPSEAAVLVEPFAATLHAVELCAARAGDKVAVLGPRRLGMLLLAALAADRKKRGISYEIIALLRRVELGELSRQFGADSFEIMTAKRDMTRSFDIVFDTTGNPEALEVAAQLAKRELHIKSTHGRPSCGLENLTELVVDELCIERLPLETDEAPLEVENYSGMPRPTLAWLASAEPSADLKERFLIERGSDAAEVFTRFANYPGIPRADAAVVDAEPAAIDAAIRPLENNESAILRPRGSIFVDPRSLGEPGQASALVRAIAKRGLRVSSSRCGDFRRALALLSSDEELRARIVQLVTHHYGHERIEEAFSMARSPACIKAVIKQKNTKPLTATRRKPAANPPPEGPSPEGQR